MDVRNRDGARMMTRRRMLAKLGIAAGAIYAAPAMLQLSEAKASSPSGRSRPSFSDGRGRRRRDHPSFSR